MENLRVAIRNLTRADGEVIDHFDPEEVRATTQIAALMRELNLKPPYLIPFHYLGHENDAAALAQSYIRSIEGNRAFLPEKFSDFVVSILNRWRPAVGKRKAFLEKAKPDLYRNQNPLVDIPSRVEQLRHQRVYRMVYMLPYLNIDDLSRDPIKFIGLLFHRTNCLLEEWVPFDHAMLWSGWKQCTLAEKSADGCIIMHGDLFGNWPTFDPVAVHLNDACGTPRAVMILESQQTLMEFLRDLTTVILERAKASKATNVLADMTFEDPAADLEYFHDNSRYHTATWFDKLEKGSYRQNTTAKQNFDNIDFIMTIKLILQARDWQWLLDERRNVKRELQESDSDISPGKPLPKGYERVLGS